MLEGYVTFVWFLATLARSVSCWGCDCSTSIAIDFNVFGVAPKPDQKDILRALRDRLIRGDVW
jgi:hypothetical protein